MLTQKHLDFLDWKKLILLKKEGAHKTTEGRLNMFKLKSGMNLNRSSQYNQEDSTLPSQDDNEVLDMLENKDTQPENIANTSLPPQNKQEFDELVVKGKLKGKLKGKIKGKVI